MNPSQPDDATRRRMQRQGQIDTAPELALRRELHRRGLRYRVDARPQVKGVRSRADLLFPSARVAVYVDGCFWHGCPTHGTHPKRNGAWWQEKLDANRLRDQTATDALEAAGFLVIRTWEHEDPIGAADAVERAVRSRRPTSGYPSPTDTTLTWQDQRSPSATTEDGREAKRGP